ncbi:MAG: AsnC family transcriptional regulator, partial [Chloroflexota bacterium]|nr:AsnC family transcriptional regulator [Chloroflexota bacterium]
MDQIDRKIVSMLGHDGRLSNAQMARELEVSEGTIRRRVKNLLDSKTISIVAASDPKKLGFFSEALIGVQCEPD